MRKYLCLVLISMFLSGAVPFSAQHMNESDSPCLNVGGTPDLVECLAKAKASSDAALNALSRTFERESRAMMRNVSLKPNDCGLSIATPTVKLSALCLAWAPARTPHTLRASNQ
jgi:hypothetical protein